MNRLIPLLLIALLGACAEPLRLGGKSQPEPPAGGVGTDRPDEERKKENEALEGNPEYLLAPGRPDVLPAYEGPKEKSLHLPKSAAILRYPSYLDIVAEAEFLWVLKTPSGTHPVEVVIKEHPTKNKRYLAYENFIQDSKEGEEIRRLLLKEDAGLGYLRRMYLQDGEMTSHYLVVLSNGSALEILFETTTTSPLRSELESIVDSIMVTKKPPAPDQPEADGEIVSEN